jgi:hypothetical protein
MPKYKVQVDKLVVYEVEVEADTRDNALESAVRQIENVGGMRDQYLLKEYPHEANFAVEVKPLRGGRNE